ncbi:MAG: hypothetical protein HFH09_01890 [Bacilli bacterium]|jgi:Tfp pilus assembly protein PilN|nr:hypothetical protein [Bacilli bacterium]
MNLNSIDIHQIILMSRKKLNLKNLLIKGLSVFTFLVCVAGLFCNNILHQVLPWTCWVGSGGCAVINVLSQVYTHAKIKHQANQQLTSLAKYLNQEGIDVSRLNLKRALVAEKLPSQVMREQGITNIVESITIFTDENEQLKALRQVRSELVQEFRPITSGDVIDVDYVEIMEDSKQVKSILEKTLARSRF